MGDDTKDPGITLICEIIISPEGKLTDNLGRSIRVVLKFIGPFGL